MEKIQQMAVKRLQHEKYKLQGQVKTWQEDMLDNYDDFFRWHADDMYMTTKAIGFLKPVLEVAKEYGIDRLKETLRHNIEHFGDDLLHGSLERSSANEMVNIANLLELKAKQRMRSFFESILFSMEETETKPSAGLQR